MRILIEKNLVSQILLRKVVSNMKIKKLPSGNWANNMLDISIIHYVYFNKINILNQVGRSKNHG